MDRIYKLLIVVSIWIVLAGCETINQQYLLQQCSRSTPIVERFWAPTDVQIQELEGNIEKLSSLESDRCCNSGKIEGALKNYSRQYAGVIILGEKYIYINAGPLGRENLNVCDGGKSYWGALYNPAKMLFSELAFNGEA